MSIKLGKYQHYKGQFYEVIGVALHTETREELVIYKMLYETKDFAYGSLWVQLIEINGSIISNSLTSNKNE